MNHYDCLKVTADAPTEVIRAAYRALAGKIHPDRQGGTMGRDDEMHVQMVALNAAYEVLINPDLRAEYDASLLTAKAKSKPKPQSGNGSRFIETEDSDNGFSDTRVDIDWMSPRPSGPRPLWPLDGARRYIAVAAAMLLLLLSAAIVWQVVSRHQMDKALSDQYAAHPPQEAADPEQVRDMTPNAPSAPKPAMSKTTEALGEPKPPPSFDRQPTVTELSRMSDEQLMAILPTLGETQPAKGSFSNQETKAHHPLDGKPLNLRTDKQLIDPLAPEAPTR